MHCKRVKACAGDKGWKETSPTGLALTTWVDSYVNVILKAMLDQLQATEQYTAPRTQPGTPAPDDDRVRRFVGWIVSRAEAAILAQEEEFVSDLVARSLEEAVKEIKEYEDRDYEEGRLDVFVTTVASQVIEELVQENVAINYRNNNLAAETIVCKMSQQTTHETPTVYNQDEQRLDKFAADFVSGVIEKIVKEHQVKDGSSAKCLNDGNMLNAFATEIVSDVLDQAKQGNGITQATVTAYQQDRLDVFAAEFVLNVLNKIVQEEHSNHSNPIQTTEKPVTQRSFKNRNACVSAAFQRIKHPSTSKPVDADFRYVYQRLTHTFGEGVDDSVISFVLDAIPQHGTWSQNFEAVDKSIRSVENHKKKHPTLHRGKAMTALIPGEQVNRPSAKPPVIRCFLDIFQLTKSGHVTTKQEDDIQMSTRVVTQKQKTESNKHSTPSRTRRFLESMRNSLFRLGISSPLSRRGQKRRFV
ncbi:uncharacterized protein LOC124116782 [Haliotis rufescens]|uniref:uncharacterized protein LOC124116782 n=1 Tax=Haliotis rufescens TaxID=6454 RepID=UPI00201FAAAB|nr:uncharacterized protein LOC124116782 [Haliotis rufescens]